ncbi:MAG: hypothetical protein CVU11_13870 [Bacteroidetes bacterium HGW-Bacteroidetes-6]|jgi:hypothetical protein|nr:MAG: hypothetical protein CVU11_13870 [Bacteroidetes bacterium HGW-Bacteroidetes-6]
MKQSCYAFLIAILAVVMLFSSCRKEEDSDINVATVLTAKMDGVLFTPAWALASLHEDELLLGGSSTSGDLNIRLGSPIVVGTYTVQSGTEDYLYWYNNQYNFSYVANPGTIIITKYDTINNRIEGTFTGTMMATGATVMNLTNGIFKITYQEIN